jgi:hypothetical protein
MSVNKICDLVFLVFLAVDEFFEGLRGLPPSIDEL